MTFVAHIRQQYLLQLIGLMYLGFGSILLMDPTFLRHAHIQLSHPTGLMEVRAFYGGMEIGLGAFFLLGAADQHRQRLLLELAFFLLLPTIFGRILGAVLDGVEGQYLWIALVVELPILLAVLVCLMRRRARS